MSPVMVAELVLEQSPQTRQAENLSYWLEGEVKQRRYVPEMKMLQTELQICNINSSQIHG